MASRTFARNGGCLCGSIRIEIDQPASETYHCHCSMCRRASGSLYQTYSIYPKNSVRIVKGADQLRDYESSPGITRRFCGRCGCQVLCEIASSPEIMSVNTGVLDAGTHPGHEHDRERHIFVTDKVEWLQIADGLPQYDQAP